MELQRLSAADWRDALPADGTTVFHDPDALSVLADHAPGELRRFAAFKGGQPVGLLPAFVRSFPVGRTVTSPPPGMGVPRLGPVVSPLSPKRSKRDAVTRTFVREALSAVGAEGSLAVAHLACPVGFEDPRPLQWNSFRVEPRFTYRVDLRRDPEAVLSDFSSSVRREVRKLREREVTVEVGGADAAERVHTDVVERFEATGDSFGAPKSFVADLVDALGERARVYVARDPDGSYLTGMVVLYHGDTAYYWLGGAAAAYDGFSANSLLHWHVVEDAADDPAAPDADWYDLVGANTERLCRYKAKLGGDLVPYYVADSGGPLGALARSVYRVR